MNQKPGPKPFAGRLIFDGGQVCEGVEGEITEGVDPRGGRKIYSGVIGCDLARAAIEVLGRAATLQTSGGLKARVSFKGVLDDEEEGGSVIEFDAIGSPLVGSYDTP